MPTLCHPQTQINWLLLNGSFEKVRHLICKYGISRNTPLLALHEYVMAAGLKVLFFCLLKIRKM